MALEDPFIGSGWSFPPAFDKKAASVSMSSGIRDIEESLRIIFSTALGERIMNPLFGCALDSSVFEVMNASRIAWLENLIRTAIIYHEARIDADQITVEPDPLAGRLLIAIGYKVRGSNSRFNFVYPYYLNEG
ncbi:GPW/gp25 family protein [Pseudomonas sp. QL9]|uniref:GPW/gp25 family protein n=1 Tax=Pseudomonas TaxID=286 RepID=UPI00191BE6E5|nr:GPW/gp25 family protein [Pseudomonas knackmussii]